MSVWGGKAGLFETGAVPVTMCSARCKVCGESSLGGFAWLRAHTCPEPYPPEYAQHMWDTLTVPGTVVHPRTKARLVMSWRFGYARSVEERRREEAER